MSLVVIDKEELIRLIKITIHNEVQSAELRTTIEAAVENVLNKTQKTNPDRVLSIREAAKYLKTSDRTLRRMAHENSIPAFRIRNRIFIRQSDLDEWIRLKTIDR